MKAREEKLGQKTEAVRCWAAEHKDEGMVGEGDVRVWQPECFGFKCAQAIEKKGDNEAGRPKCAQAYLSKGLSSFSGWRTGRRRWDAGALTT
jgi:hypothetical protein